MKREKNEIDTDSIPKIFTDNCMKCSRVRCYGTVINCEVTTFMKLSSVYGVLVKISWVLKHIIHILLSTYTFICTMKNSDSCKTSCLTCFVRLYELFLFTLSLIFTNCFSFKLKWIMQCSSRFSMILWTG